MWYQHECVTSMSGLAPWPRLHTAWLVWPVLCAFLPFLSASLVLQQTLPTISTIFYIRSHILTDGFIFKLSLSSCLTYALLLIWSCFGHDLVIGLACIKYIMLHTAWTARPVLWVNALIVTWPRSNHWPGMHWIYHAAHCLNCSARALGKCFDHDLVIGLSCIGYDNVPLCTKHVQHACSALAS